MGSSAYSQLRLDVSLSLATGRSEVPHLVIDHSGYDGSSHHDKKLISLISPDIKPFAEAT